MKRFQFPFFCLLCIAFFGLKLPAQTTTSNKTLVIISGEQKKWHTITFTFEGPRVNEMDQNNPFFNYRLEVVFSQNNQQFSVPGYFAADGDAANTSATGGNKWRVHFSPPKVGVWKYDVNFKKGEQIAVSGTRNKGESAGFMDQFSGQFRVLATDKSGRDFRAKGQLRYIGQHYLQFAETGEYFLKAGADAPENFLSYAGFDGDFKSDGHKDNLVKTWEPHIRDWKSGDPTWQRGKGKGIIGALNYLAAKGMNAFSFLTLNIKGDDQNVFPYVAYEDFTRMDVSKLDQWNIVFSHAQKLGLFLHFKTQEIENQGLLDEGNLGIHRKLYYRELIARFGHHLALNWNLGEENGYVWWAKNNPTPEQSTEQRIAMAEFFYQNDPYHHHIVIHNGTWFYDLLGNKSKITGPSIQTDKPDFREVHHQVLRWRHLSAGSGKPWVITVDEPGDAQHSLVPDKEDPEHNEARINALWGTFMGGGAGIEWYFGYKHDHSDLTCQDWRSRDIMWDQSRYPLEFFRDNQLPFWEMIPDDALTHSPDDYCFFKPGEVYVIFLKKGGKVRFESGNAVGDFRAQWYNPRIGQFSGQKQEVSVTKMVELEEPPYEKERDWVVLLQKKKN